MCNSPSGFYWDFKAGKPLRFNGAAALYGRSYVRALVCGEGEKKWGRFGGGGERKEDRRDGSVNVERANQRLVHAYGWKMEYV